MYRALITILCCSFMVFFQNETGWAQQTAHTKIVRVIGTGSLTSGNTAAARKEAISNSLISAVASVAIGSFPLKPIIQNFDEVNAIIYGNSNDFIQSNFIQDYKVLTETQYKNMYQVIVQASVSVDKLQQHFSEAGIVFGTITMPKILFLLSEKNVGDEAPTYWWGNIDHSIQTTTDKTLLEILYKKGFHILNTKAAFQKNPAMLKQINADINDQTAIKLGQYAKADIVIVGKSYANQTPNTMGSDIRSFRGSISVRALRTATGKAVAATTQSHITVENDPTAGGLKAITEASRSAAKKLAPSIIAAWQEENTGSAMVEVSVKGTNYLSNFVKFRKAVEEMPGVNEVQTREMKADEAIIAVNYNGNGKALAEALMLKTFGSFGLNITKTTPKNVHVVLIAK